MISIPQEHYNKLLSLIASLHSNFTLLLNSQNKHSIHKLFQQFTSLNTNLKASIESINSQSQQYKIILLQYESELNLMKQKYQTQLQTIKSSQTELTKLRQELSKMQKQHAKLKDLNKQLKQQLANKDNSIKEIQEQVKSQVKAIKKEYKEENKQLKERVKKLQSLLATAIVTNKNQQVEQQLDKQLQSLKQYQLQ